MCLFFQLTPYNYLTIVSAMNAISGFSRAAQIFAAIIIFTGLHAQGQSVITTTSPGVITQTLSFSNQGPGAPVYNFNLFDSNQGTLNSVTIELVNITSTGSAVVTNTSNQPAPFGNGPPGYDENIVGGFTNTYSATSSTSGADTATVAITSATTGTVVKAGDALNTGLVSASQSPNPVTNVVSDKANYIGTGTGTITITLNSTTGANVSGNAGTNTFYVFGTAQATASGSLVLIYNYTPVPEPKTTAAMIGLALCILLGRNYFKGRGGFRLA